MLKRFIGPLAVALALVLGVGVISTVPTSQPAYASVHPVLKKCVYWPSGFIGVDHIGNTQYPPYWKIAYTVSKLTFSSFGKTYTAHHDVLDLNFAFQVGWAGYAYNNNTLAYIYYSLPVGSNEPTYANDWQPSNGDPGPPYDYDTRVANANQTSCNSSNPNWAA